MKLIHQDNDIINKAAEMLKIANPMELVKRCVTVVQDIKKLERERDELQSQIANMRTQNLFDNAVDVNGIKVIVANLGDIKTDMLRKISDDVKARAGDYLCVIAGVDGEKGNFAVACGKDGIAKGVHSGKIAGKVAALTGGKGGGRPDSAMAGVGDVTKVDAALENAIEIVKEFMK